MSRGWRFKGKEYKYIKKLLDNDISPKSSDSMNEQLERKFSKIHQQKYAVTSNSGTSTLHQALNAFGVGRGDEVIVPALTVAMCGFVIWQCGATPVYADVKKDTFLIDPEDIKKKITKKTKAILVVHLYGLMCDMDEIIKIAKKNKLFVLEDCAQCYLGTDHKKRISGTVGDAGSWSFERSKHLSTGEGGILTTNNKKIAEKMRKFGGVGFKNLTALTGKGKIDRSKFQNPSWVRHDMFAYNYRMSEITAAVGLAQVQRINFFLKKRINSGRRYKEVISNFNNDILIPQFVPKNFKHSYFTFAAIFNGEKYRIKWMEFKNKFIKFGGDGIYAAWQTIDNELPFKIAKTLGLFSGSKKISNKYGWGKAPTSYKLQKKLMQFTTNQKGKKEIDKQINALKKTISYFKLN